MEYKKCPNCGTQYNPATKQDCPICQYEGKPDFPFTQKEEIKGSAFEHAWKKKFEHGQS